MSKYYARKGLPDLPYIFVLKRPIENIKITGDILVGETKTRQNLEQIT